MSWPSLVKVRCWIELGKLTKLDLVYRTKKPGFVGVVRTPYFAVASERLTYCGDKSPSPFFPLSSCPSSPVLPFFLLSSPPFLPSPFPSSLPSSSYFPTSPPLSPLSFLLPLLLHPSPPTQLEEPWERCKLPQRLRAEPGHQTHLGAF